MRYYLIILVLVLYSSGSIAQISSENSVYQFETKVGSRIAYLWIPPSCKYVRGIIFAAENALERNWMESPLIRKTATDENLAMVWLADGKDSKVTYEIRPEAAELLDTMFHDLAEVSGYREIEFAPLIITGHSWNGRMAWNYPAQRPDRVIAAVAIRTYPMPDTLLFQDIPFLYIVGQTTELPQYNDGRPGDRDFFWPIVRQTSLALRAKNEHNLIGVVVNPGGCHMDWTDGQSVFLSLFIHKACQYRLPTDKPLDGKVKLKRIDIYKGWLTDSGCLEPDHFRAAKYKHYKGDTRKAFWFFDQQFAKAAIAFNGDRRPHLKQMTTLVQFGDTLIVKHNGYAQLSWGSQDSSNTFILHGGFLSKYPAGLTDSGRLLGHAIGPVRLYHVMGPALQLNDTTFRLQFDRQAIRNVMIMADQPGDGLFGRATQGGILTIPSKLKEGMDQEIEFPEINDQPLGTLSLRLEATASSGLPVQYYVKSGPAIIKGNQLFFTQVPEKSRYPVKVIVVACQYGRITSPLISSALPVSRVFYITDN